LPITRLRARPIAEDHLTLPGAQAALDGRAQLGQAGPGQPQDQCLVDVGQPGAGQVSRRSYSIHSRGVRGRVSGALP
jgi:hypothetical protein